MSQPHELSLIVPTWNAAATIGAALDSALGQTLAPLEIIVIDDGSTDETVQVLEPYLDRICYVYQPNAGASAARNRGVALANCELIAFLDADDLFPPDALETLCAGLAQDLRAIPHGQIRDFLRVAGELVLSEPRYAANLGSALFRRTLLKELGGFTESLRLGEDLDLWMRAREHGIRRDLVPAVTYWYNRRVSDGTDSGAVHLTTLARLLKSSLERSRQYTQ